MSDPATNLRRAVVQYARARHQRDEAIREAANSGMKKREIAAITGLPNQRIHKIAKSGS